MSKLTRAQHEAANDLLASLTWTDGDVDQDLAAQAIADAGQRGAERERAAVLRALAVIPYKDAFQFIEAGKHRENEDE